MVQCTAPVMGHRSPQARENCPVCSNTGYYRGYSSYSSYSSYTANRDRVNSSSSGNTKPRWSNSGSNVVYTTKQIKTLTPFRQVVERKADLEVKDVFLCHAWEDRKTSAKNLCDYLTENGTSVWFSENDIPLGSNLLREIDKGLAKCRVGIVFVTPSFLKRIQGNGVADKELSALLAQDTLLPILDGVTFEELRDVSPLLGSRSGLTTDEETMKEIADKISEVVSV